MKLNEDSFAPADDETEGGGAGWLVLAVVLALLVAGLAVAGVMAAG